MDIVQGNHGFSGHFTDGYPLPYIKCVCVGGGEAQKLSGHCPCPLSRWKLSTESMDNVHLVTLSMDSVDNFHGLIGHCPWTLSSPVIPILQLDNVHDICPLRPWTF